MDAADQHEVLMRATGAHPHRVPAGSSSATAEPAPLLEPNPVVRSFGEAMASIADFVEVVVELLDQLDLIEDDEGRAIWLTAEEVELDQWLGRLVAARDAMRDRFELGVSDESRAL